MGLLGNEFISKTKEFDDAFIEFDTLANISFYKYVEQASRSPNVKRYYGPGVDVNKRVRLVAYTFASLEILGYHELKEYISCALTEQPILALRLLETLSVLIVDPRSNPFDAIHNVTRRELESTLVDLPKKVAADSGLDLRPPICEIGKFLMNKLAPYPTSFEACREMCDSYKHYDLHQVMLALQQAVKTEDYSGIRSESKQLSDILDNIWDDTKKIIKRANLIRAGIPLSIALLGEVAAGPIGASVGGLLAKLGYDTVEKVIEIKTDSLSEKIAKYSVPNYLVNIFDFKKKYRTTYDSKVHSMMLV